MKNILFFLFFSLFVGAKAQNTVVKTTNGKIEGTANADKTVRIFKGIPFAASPVGDLRWRAPQPVKKWKGTK